MGGVLLTAVLVTSAASIGPSGPTVRLCVFRAAVGVLLVASPTWLVARVVGGEPELPGVLLVASPTWLVARVVGGEPELPGVRVAAPAAGLVVAALTGIALANEDRVG